MIVYTFWEPRESIPYYLQLCMETWKRFLPNAEIVVLDYENIGEYVDINKDIGSNLLSGRFSLPMIADAIRVALLAKYGGIWMDIDTIILSSDAEKYLLPDEKNKIIFFGDLKHTNVHIAFINTPPNSICINLWLDYIREKLKNLTPETKITWYFMGNGFINVYVKKHLDEITILDADIHKPEMKIITEALKKIYPVDPIRGAYFDYYFMRNYHLKDIDTDLLLLHNSWTPPTFKKFSPEEVLRCDCTMTNILAEILEMKLPPQNERIRFKDMIKK